jgi:hypothetical protein
MSVKTGSRWDSHPLEAVALVSAGMVGGYGSNKVGQLNLSGSGLEQCTVKSVAGVVAQAEYLGLEIGLHVLPYPRRNEKSGLFEAIFKISDEGWSELLDRLPAGEIKDAYIHQVNQHLGRRLFCKAIS